ncbi:MAG: DegV family protein [Lachnospiraceae bacterium]|nr:DegV family protein [Lachnospiraceae bacterium]
MKEKYILSCCSTVDLTEEQLKEIDVEHICFHYELDGKTYLDDLGKSMSADEFYQRMADGADTKTSQIAPEEFKTYFRRYLEAGRDILHVTLSSGISGVYNSAQMAAEELAEEYPERKIYIADSLAASSGYGLLMIKLSELRASGMTVDQLRDWAEQNKKRLRHWFFSTDLTFFIKGGRISKTAGLFGTALNICPLMDVSCEGKMIPRFNIRTKKKVIREMVKKMEEQADHRESYSDRVFISHSACMEDARAVADLVETKFPKINGKVQINNIGTTIGAHTGPGTVALFFWGDERID